MALTESDTRAQYIDPALAKSGWEGHLVRREFQITAGRIIGAGKRAEPSITDYLLEYKGKRLAVIEAKKNDCVVLGPYSADAFFARGIHEKFDAVLAMYHDQGLIPFKSLALGEGTNFTAGLPVIRTSPDHGTAFDIAGKNKADAGSFTASIFECIRIIHARQGYRDMRLNPMKKMSARMFAGTKDEILEGMD